MGKYTNANSFLNICMMHQLLRLEDEAELCWWEKLKMQWLASFRDSNRKRLESNGSRRLSRSSCTAGCIEGVRLSECFAWRNGKIGEEGEREGTRASSRHKTA